MRGRLINRTLPRRPPTQAAVCRRNDLTRLRGTPPAETTRARLAGPSAVTLTRSPSIASIRVSPVVACAMIAPDPSTPTGCRAVVLALMGAELAAPDHTTLSRRSQQLAVMLRRLPAMGPSISSSTALDNLLKDHNWPSCTTARGPGPGRLEAGARREGESGVDAC